MSGLRPSVAAFRAESAQRGFHPDLGHGYGFEDGAGRVPKSEPDTILGEIDRRERERSGVVESVPSSQLARECDLQFIRELFDAVFLEDLKAFHHAHQKKFQGGGRKQYSERLRRSIGTKFLLTVWLVEPEFLSVDGNPISLSELARLFGVSPPALSPITAELSAKLGIRNEFQAHDSSSAHYKATREGRGVESSEDDDQPQAEQEEINESN